MGPHGSDPRGDLWGQIGEHCVRYRGNSHSCGFEASTPVVKESTCSAMLRATPPTPTMAMPTPLTTAPVTRKPVAAVVPTTRFESPASVLTTGTFRSCSQRFTTMPAAPAATNGKVLLTRLSLSERLGRWLT